jgi:hypothetical protein
LAANALQSQPEYILQITDLLQRQTLIGRDNGFNIIPTNQIIQIGDVAVASIDTEIASKPRAGKEYKCGIALVEKKRKLSILSRMASVLRIPKFPVYTPLAPGNFFHCRQ